MVVLEIVVVVVVVMVELGVGARVGLGLCARELGLCDQTWAGVHGRGRRYGPVLRAGPVRRGRTGADMATRLVRRGPVGAGLQLQGKLGGS